MNLAQKTLCIAVFAILSTNTSFAKKPNFIHNKAYIVGGATVTEKILNVPHNWEYNRIENPYRYWWCGHAALKSVIQAFGYTKTLAELDRAFEHVDTKFEKKKSIYVSPNEACSKGRCAYTDIFADTLKWYRDEKHGIYLNTYTTRYNKDQFFNAVKSAIDNKKLVIVESKKYYRYDKKSWDNVGHYMVIIGYSTARFPYNNIEVDSSRAVYIRDPIKEYSGGTSDNKFSLDAFWDNVNKYGLAKTVIIWE